ncbi:MAG: YfhO family protein [Solirubrobacteraceae bacterium]
MRRPTLTAAAVYALLALALVGHGLIPGRTLSASDYLWSGAPWRAAAPAGVGGLGSNYEQADAVLVFQPLAQWARGPLPDVPLWNPHVMGGRPYVANAQSALFSPFTWPMLVLPFWWSLGVVAALKLFTAAMGTFLLGRALGMRFAGALLAGIVFAFGLYFVVWLSWPLSSVWAWLPWLLLAVLTVARRPGALPVAGLALVVALEFFGGHPESSFHVLAAASLFALLALSRVAHPRRAAGRLLAGLVAGSALAAVAVVPFVELLLHSADLGARRGREPLHLEPRFLLGYALPEYWGRPSGPQTEGFMVARAFYAGALPLMLAVWAVIARPTRERVAIAAGGAAAVAVVVGFPGVFELVNALPGFDQAYNTRLIVVASLAIALLAGWGLDERPPLLFVGAIWALPLVLVVARVPLDDLGEALSVAWGFATPPPLPEAVTVLRLSAALVWLVVAGAAVVLLWWRPPAFAALACALVVADLFRAGMGQNPSIPVDHAEQPATEAIQRLRAARPARFAGLAPAVGLQPLVPDLAMRYGLYDARGYDYPVERRFDRLWRAMVAPPEGFTPPTMLVEPTERALRALGMLGVTDVVQPPGEPRVPGWDISYEGEDARLYENPYALPRAWVVGEQWVVPDPDVALAAMLEPAFDPARTAVVERPVPGLDGTGDARIVRYEPDRVEAEASATSRALVVLSDVHFPGWKATVDGRDAPVERVDYLLRGVPVGAGEHSIVLEYRPLSWRIGWIVSLLAALTLVWKSARGWARSTGSGAWRWAPRRSGRSSTRTARAGSTRR